MKVYIGEVGHASSTGVWWERELMGIDAAVIARSMYLLSIKGERVRMLSFDTDRNVTVELNTDEVHRLAKPPFPGIFPIRPEDV